NTVYAAVPGSGVWRTTTTVNGAWSLISGSPTYVESAVVVGGAYYCAGGPFANYGNNTTLLKWNGTWSTLVTDPQGIHAVAANRKEPTNLVYLNYAGRLNQVSTTGTNLLQYAFYSVSANDCPALALMPASGNWFSAGQVVFDPIVPQKIWISTGIGIFYT